MEWSEALAYCENLIQANATDWRLPDAKELQSIVDYTRSPATTGSAAIDPLFSASTIIDERGTTNYPFYWTSTTHASSDGKGSTGVYIAFGEALGYMNGTWIDVHGAGAQRSDPKSGDASAYPTGRGPQGDAIRIDNYVRCVRSGSVVLDVNAELTSPRTSGDSSQPAAGEQPGDPGQDGQPPVGGQPGSPGQDGQPPAGGQPGGRGQQGSQPPAGGQPPPFL